MLDRKPPTPLSAIQELGAKEESPRFFMSASFCSFNIWGEVTCKPGEFTGFIYGRSVADARSSYAKQLADHRLREQVCRVQTPCTPITTEPTPLLAGQGTDA